MVANYVEGKRRFDSYPTEGEAIEAARRIARKLSEQEVLAAGMTNEQAADYVAAMQALRRHNVPLPVAAAVLAQCLESLGDLPVLFEAVKFYAVRNRRVIRKRVADVVMELLEVKKSRNASGRYLHDLRSRLNRFAGDFQKDCCDVTTAEVQNWLDALHLSPQSYENFRRVVHLLFKFAAARGYATDNPAAGAESIKVTSGEVEVLSSVEIRQQLATVSTDFLPCIAIGAFAGLRSAEIERLEWRDIHLVEGHIVVGKDKAKTASRRIVPICDALAAWLASYTTQTGVIWGGDHRDFYAEQRDTASRAGLRWKKNGLRHSYASYRFALTADAGRVAGELGNSAAMIHNHYRELVKPAEAAKWFAVKPEGSTANIAPMVNAQ